MNDYPRRYPGAGGVSRRRRGLRDQFLFSARTRPANKSHREQAILVKDLVHQALREAEKSGTERERPGLTCKGSSTWRETGKETGRGPRLCLRAAAENIWREFDLPPQLAKTQLFVNRRFHLKELAVLLGGQPRLWVAFVDRHRARFFDLHLDEVKEQEALFRPLPRRGRGDGFAGYDAGHAERSVNDEALHHFKNVAELLKLALEKGHSTVWLSDVRISTGTTLRPHLHPYVKSRLLGRFAAEVGSATEKQVREQGDRMVRESLAQHRHEQMKEVLDQARSNGRGVTGLRRVLRSLEMGEVQVLLMAEIIPRTQSSAPAAVIWMRTWCTIVRSAAGARRSWKMCAMPLFQPPSGAMWNWCM